MSTFMKPSEASASDGWKFSVEENIGGLFLFYPKEETSIEDKFNGGERKIIVADIVEIDLENAEDSELHEDVWVFPAWIQGALRSSIADKGMVLGRLGQDAEKDRGKNVAWVLEDPDEEDVEAATAYLDTLGGMKTASEGSGKTKKKGKK